MDRVVRILLAPLSSAPRDCWESGGEPTWRPLGADCLLLRRTEAPGGWWDGDDAAAAASAAFGSWKIYFFSAVAVLAVLAGLWLFCFSFSVLKSCTYCENLEEPEDESFDIPWNIPIIQQPEPYGICASQPQPIPYVRFTRHFRNTSVPLTCVTKDWGIQTRRVSSLQTSAAGIGQGSPSKTLGNGTDSHSSVETIFNIEDLD